MSGRVEARFPPKLKFLFDKHRYKVLYGGRGGAKSWGVARALLIQGMNRPLKILCAREFQNSLDQSSYALLVSQIKALGFEDFYEIQKTTIIGRNGTIFAFKGLKLNIASVKSFEDCSIVWVEEAQTVSKSSWDTLIPTIRKEGSEIWVTFNPLLSTDETYIRFVLNPPPTAKVVKIDWRDNNYFPDVLRQEMEHLKENDPDAWLNVWEGQCRVTLDGAVYAKELRDATEQGRIMRVPYDPSKPVHLFFDLGWSDATAIWLAQVVGFEYRILEYIEDHQRTIQHFLQVLQNKPYTYGTFWLPHDGAAKTLASGGRSIEQQLKDAGKTVKIVPRLSVADGINAARTVFPLCYFDEEKCKDGLDCLRHYRYEVDENTGGFSRNPIHDENSHGADGFRMLAVSIKEKKTNVIKLPNSLGPQMPVRAGGWMG